MANIAQTVNVLQAVILTEGDKMVLTPTYHVFKMFKEHQNNTLLGSYITTDISIIDSKKRPSDEGSLKLPQLMESSSVDDNGVIYSTIVNTSEAKTAKIKCQIANTNAKNITAEIITGDIHDKNDFDNPNVVQTEEFTDFRKLKDGFTAILPKCSVVKFTIEK